MLTNVNNTTVRHDATRPVGLVRRATSGKIETLTRAELFYSRRVRKRSKVVRINFFQPLFRLTSIDVGIRRPPVPCQLGAWDGRPGTTETLHTWIQMNTKGNILVHEHQHTFTRGQLDSKGAPHLDEGHTLVDRLHTLINSKELKTGSSKNT